MTMRRAFLVSSAALTLAVGVAACTASTSSSSKTITTGQYQASNYQAGTDTCVDVNGFGANFDPTAFNWPIYVNGGDVNFSDGLALGSNQSSTSFHVVTTFPYRH